MTIDQCHSEKLGNKELEWFEAHGISRDPNTTTIKFPSFENSFSVCMVYVFLMFRAQ